MSHTLSMTKGSTLSLTKADNTPLRKLRVELSWNPNTEKFKGTQFDLDVMAVVAKNEAFEAVSQQHFCFFNQPTTPAIKVSDDNQTGEGDGADETLWIDLEQVPANGTHIPVIVNIYGAQERGQSFADVNGTKVVLFNDETNEELANCVISDVAANTDISLLFSVIERTATGFEYSQVNQFFPVTLEQWMNKILG